MMGYVKQSSGLTQPTRINQQSSLAMAQPAVRPPSPSSRGGGQPLSREVRSDMERRFHWDFGAIRIHRDAGALGNRVQAYTQGTDIHFGADPGSFSTPQKKGLLGHELTHVIQQSQGRVATSGAGGGQIVRDPALEAEAHRSGRAISAGAAPDLGRQGGAGGHAALSSAQAPIQCSEGYEHQAVGNEANRNLALGLGQGAQDPFFLTSGDINALSGDYFRADDPDDPATFRPETAEDNLFVLAARPGRGGKGVGTRDEVIYALLHLDEDAVVKQQQDATLEREAFRKKDGPAGAPNPRLLEERTRDPRFLPDGIWGGYVFSEEVKSKVTARFRKLAAQNRAHYVQPQGQASSPATQESEERMGSGVRYRQLHESALRTAYRAGRKQAPAGVAEYRRALAVEFGAQHFLVDSFSGGHLRTPVGGLRDFWNRKYPLFWFNLKQNIALRVAVEFAGSWTGGASAFRKVILGALAEKTAGLEVSLGDLIAKVFHDWDSLHGVAVAQGGRVYGDRHLNRGEGRGMAVAALQAGTADIEAAYALGQSSSRDLEKEQICAAVRAQTGGQGQRYVAESLLPDPRFEGQPNYQAGSFEELWDKPLFENSDRTFGQQITAALRPGQEVYQMVSELGAEFASAALVGPLLARAYNRHFLAPLSQRPRDVIRILIHWAPTDDMFPNALAAVARENLAELSLASRAPQPGEVPAGLYGLTVLGRAGHIRSLAGSRPMSQDAQPDDLLIVQLFQTARADERRALYAVLEGHPWNGDWQPGDGLWQRLRQAALQQIRGLLNQSAGY